MTMSGGYCYHGIINANEMCRFMHAISKSVLTCVYFSFFSFSFLFFLFLIFFSFYSLCWNIQVFFIDTVIISYFYFTVFFSHIFKPIIQIKKSIITWTFWPATRAYIPILNVFSSICSTCKYVIHTESQWPIKDPFSYETAIKLVVFQWGLVLVLTIFNVCVNSTLKSIFHKTLNLF